MRAFPFWALPIYLGQALAACNADNCARAVTGTFQRSNPTRLADCQSFQQCTVTPPVVRYTSTVVIVFPPSTQTVAVNTVTVTETSIAAKAKRSEPQETPVVECPSRVPSYASACSGSARYASACSCAGFTKTYQTVPNAVEPTTIVVTASQAVETVSVTETTTVVVVVTPKASSVRWGI